jgi:hypothetical protein
MILFNHQDGFWVRIKGYIIYWLRKPKLTFTERLVRVSLFWGIPMASLELIGIPYRDWAALLIFVLPATAAGVIVYALLEHGLASLRKADNR